jgi:hypothetical protein
MLNSYCVRAALHWLYSSTIFLRDRQGWVEAEDKLPLSSGGQAASHPSRLEDWQLMENMKPHRFSLNWFLPNWGWLLPCTRPCLPSSLAELLLSFLVFPEQNSGNPLSLSHWQVWGLYLFSLLKLFRGLTLVCDTSMGLESLSSKNMTSTTYCYKF